MWGRLLVWVGVGGVYNLSRIVYNSVVMCISVICMNVCCWCVVFRVLVGVGLVGNGIVVFFVEMDLVCLVCVSIDIGCCLVLCWLLCFRGLLCCFSGVCDGVLVCLGWVWIVLVGCWRGLLYWLCCMEICLGWRFCLGWIWEIFGGVVW